MRPGVSPRRVDASASTVNAGATTPQSNSRTIDSISGDGPVTTATRAWSSSKSLLGSVWARFSVSGGKKIRPASYPLARVTSSGSGIGSITRTLRVLAARAASRRR